MTGRSEFEDEASRMLHTFSDMISRAPSAYTQLLIAVDFGIGPTSEVVIAGERSAEDACAMIGSLRKNFIPRKVVLIKPAGEESKKLTQLAEYASEFSMINGKATAFVCRGFRCSLPTTDASRMLELLDSVEE
jgi:uncharacterized protein YyaL (SSP411 family)